MSNTSKRLSDVAKQNTVDRASSLVRSFIPPPAAPAPVNPVPETTSVEPVEVAPVASVSAVEPEPQPVTPAPVAKPERSRKTAATGFTDMITQAFPTELRCDKPIMLTAAHHQLLRKLSFEHNKPMTELLYNLLEAATQPYQRDQQNHV